MTAFAITPNPRVTFRPLGAVTVVLIHALFAQEQQPWTWTSNSTGNLVSTWLCLSKDTSVSYCEQRFKSFSHNNPISYFLSEAAQGDLFPHFLGWSTIWVEIICLHRTVIFLWISTNVTDSNQWPKFTKADLLPSRLQSSSPQHFQTWPQVGDLKLLFGFQTETSRAYCSKYGLAVLKAHFSFVFRLELYITFLHTSQSEPALNPLPSSSSVLRVHWGHISYIFFVFIKPTEQWGGGGEEGFILRSSITQELEL